MKKTEDILKELEDMDSPLAGMSGETPFLVPDGYFDQLQDNILMACRSSVSLPAIAEADRTLPRGYFEALPDRMLELAKAGDSKPSRLVRLGRVFRPDLKWAAAAVFLLCISEGIYRNFFLGPDYERELARLPQEMVSAYAQKHMDPSDIPQAEASGQSVLMIGSLRHEEIVQYLDETGWE